MNLAYDEYERLSAARRAWIEHQGKQRESGAWRRGRGQAPGKRPFDAGAYIEERRQQLLDQLAAEQDDEDTE